MPQWLKLPLVLFTWLLATGAQWDVLQVVAWGRMFANNAQTMEISEAAKKTFSGEMCALCKAVKAAREQEQRQLPMPDAAKGKIVLICQFSDCRIIAAPVAFAPERAPHARLPDERGDAPPVPPPRAHGLS